VRRMTPAQRQRVIDALDAILPLPGADCVECDPNGGCPNPTECRRILAEEILDVIDRETA
jgi:hypothetical protein